jgi:hypothetical protein
MFLYLLLVIITKSTAFWHSSGYRNTYTSHYLSDVGQSFDPVEYDKTLKNVDVGNRIVNCGVDQKVLESISNENDVMKEEIFRKYPFDDYKLPVLSDCNNYYSGKYNDSFWHQNADQVLVYIPVDQNINIKDISVRFEAKSVDLKIEDSLIIHLDFMERIIPDGSFWTIEFSKDGKKYIQFDLEKR